MREWRVGGHHNGDVCRPPSCSYLHMLYIKEIHQLKKEAKVKFVVRKRAQNYHYPALCVHWLMELQGMGDCCGVIVTASTQQPNSESIKTAAT